MSSRQFRIICLSVLVTVVTSARGSTAGPRWPQWRGPGHHAGVDTPLPTSWSLTSNIAWSATLSGPGNSTPVIWDDRIVWTVGRRRWRVGLESRRARTLADSIEAVPSAETPRRLELQSVSGHRWSTSLGVLQEWDVPGAHHARTRPLAGQYGGPFWTRRTGVGYWDVSGVGLKPCDCIGDERTAPVLGGVGPREWEPRVAGSVSVPVRLRGRPGIHDAYGLSVRGREVVLAWNAEHLKLHDTRDEPMVWDWGGFNPEQRPDWPPVASPARVEDRIVVPYGRGHRLFAVDLVGDGDVTTQAHRWVRTDTGSYVPTPVPLGRRLLLRGSRTLWCVGREP